MQPVHVSLWLRPETPLKGTQEHLPPYSPRIREGFFSETDIRESAVAA
jgi:hypothetical protein